MPEQRPTRRQALAAGLAGLGALALGRAGPAAARGADEGRALTELIRAEEDAVFVYRTAGIADVAATFAEHDTEHARALASHLEALGMPIPGPTRGRDDLAPDGLAVLQAPAGEARLRTAIAYERSLIAGGVRRLGALEQPNTVRTAATVLASHAQHLLSLELISRR